MEFFSVEEAKRKFNHIFIKETEEFINIVDFEHYIEKYKNENYTFYGTYKEEMKFDASSIIENACEDLYTEAEDDCDIGKLQKLLDDYAAEQNIVSYYEDLQSVIKIK